MSTEQIETTLESVFFHIHRQRHTCSHGMPVEPWALALAEHVFRHPTPSRRSYSGAGAGTSHQALRPGGSER